MNFDLNIGDILSAILSGLVLLVFNRVGQVRDMLNMHNMRIGTLETINSEREKMMLEHVERVRGDIAEIKGKVDAHQTADDREMKIIRDRIHEIPTNVHTEMMRVHIKIARIQERLTLPEE